MQLIPAMTRYFRFAFRELRYEEHQESVSEALAHAFCAFRRLVELGKQDLAYASPLARFAVAHTRAGRRVGSTRNSLDVFGGQGRRESSLKSLQARSSISNVWVESLADDTLTPIPDQVAFRLDFPAWLSNLSRRDRKLATFLAVGNTPAEAAERFGVSRPRISQLRGQLETSWRAFHGELPKRITNIHHQSQTRAI
jgi:hypothetical protein